MVGYRRYNTRRNLIGIDRQGPTPYNTSDTHLSATSFWSPSIYDDDFQQGLHQINCQAPCSNEAQRYCMHIDHITMDKVWQSPVPDVLFWISAVSINLWFSQVNPFFHTGPTLKHLKHRSFSFSDVWLGAPSQVKFWSVPRPQNARLSGERDFSWDSARRQKRCSHHADLWHHDLWKGTRCSYTTWTTYRPSWANDRVRLCPQSSMAIGCHHSCWDGKACNLRAHHPFRRTSAFTVPMVLRITKDLIVLESMGNDESCFG